MNKGRTAAEIQQSWDTDPRWQGITREYTADDVVRLRGSFHVEHSIARNGAELLWKLVHSDEPVRALGAVTGNQAVQQVTAGLKAIYVSGWQVAADANRAGQMYPDQSLYPSYSVPRLVRAINNALMRHDQIGQLNGGDKSKEWMAPVVADAEAGFGGNLNAFELMKLMVEHGAAAVHFEDQVAAYKKCGHLGGKVLEPVRTFIQKLLAARLAADIFDLPSVLIARTDANSATLLTNNIDPRDWPFLDGARTSEGFFTYGGCLDAAISRGIAYAPYSDMIWCETSKPDLEEAKLFAEGVHQHFPNKKLAYNCSPSFNWSRNLDATTIAKFQTELAAMGYTFQFVTLAGFHTLNYSMFDLSKGYEGTGMSAYSELQDKEFVMADEHGYAAHTHQSFVGTGYFDAVARCVSGGEASTTAMDGSTESEQF